MSRYKKTKYILRSLGIASLFLSSAIAHGMANRLQNLKKGLLQAIHSITVPWSKQPPSSMPHNLPSLKSGIVAKCPTIVRAAGLENFFLKQLSPSAQVKLIRTEPNLLSHLIDDLSDKQTILFVEELSKEDKELRALRCIDIMKIEKISNILLKKASKEVHDRFAYHMWHLIPKEKKGEWLKMLEREKYNPFAEYQAKGPIFSEARNFEKAKVTQLTASTIAPNFEALLPNILEHVAHEYDQGRFVGIHSRSASWMLLERVYHALYNLTHEKKAPDDFIHLRFRDHSTLKEDQLKRMQTNGEEYKFENLLFTNLLLFKDEPPVPLAASRNSWLFATKGIDESENRLRNADPNWIIASIKKMFTDAGMEKEYAKLITQKPHIFEELKTLFEEAVKEQGNHGQLLVLSMPNKVAQESVYFADHCGRLLPGHDPILDAKNIHQLCGLSTEWCTVLRDEFINPEAAEKAGVKIVGFDPAGYQRTSKYRKFEEKLEEITKDIEKMRTSNP